jgi:signal transduction histidine kinase/ligand-binding sensor domain-containing protein
MSTTLAPPDSFKGTETLGFGGGHGWRRAVFGAGWVILCGLALAGLGLPAAGAAGAFSEKTPYAMRYWLREDGLPLNAVTSLVQTRDGYIWIGTYNGLARFDGVRFTVFDSGSIPGLASSRITSLYEGDDGALWIGHEGGELTRYLGGQFETRPVKASWRQRKIMNIAADDSGDIWLQNDEGLLARERDGRVLTPESGVFPGVIELTSNERGEIWVVRNGRVSALQGGMVKVLAFGGNLTNTIVSAIAASRGGGVWVVADDGRLRRWKDQTWVEDRGVPPYQGAPMIKLVETRSRTLVGGTSDHGFAMIFPDGKSAQFSRAANGFSADWIVTLLEDREGGLWVGTGGAGLALVRESCIENISPPDAWQGRAVLSVCASRAGTLWVGTEGNGLYRYQNGGWTNYAFKAGLANPYVWSLAEDQAGNMWAGTWNAGLFVWRGDRFERAPGLPATVSPMAALLPAGQGGLWIGTGAGLLRYDPPGELATWGKPGVPGNIDVRCIAEARDGAVWFGTAGQGLLCLKQGAVQSFGQAQGLPSEFIQCLHEDEQGAIWIGTFGGGLSRFKDGRLATIKVAQGLADNVICDIEDDGRGNFWMSSYNGILCVSQQALNQCADGAGGALHCATYGISDGLPTLECSGGLQPAGCRTSDGRIWFATSRGLVAVNPQAVKVNYLPPPVRIERLLVDDEAVPELELSGGPLKIPPGRHRLEIQYTGLCFSAPEKVQFKHRLDGLDTDWVEAGGKRAVDYRYIPPGEYTFHVLACNNDGVWNNDGATLSFAVLPYFWQTVWFRVLGFSAVMALTAAGVWQGTRRRMRRKLERVEHQRSLERERTRIAKDIHDDLGASLTRINLLSQSARRDMADEAQTVKNLEQICTTARKLTRAMDEIVWAVDPQHDTLDSLASYLGKLIHEVFGDSGIRCRLDFPMELPPWPVTAEVRHNLFLAFKEALHNVLKHAGATTVLISFTLEPAAFAVKITDDGCGFDAAELAIQPRPRRNGLVNMRQRLEEIGGRCEITSERGRGTQVTFILPAKQ